MEIQNGDDEIVPFSFETNADNLENVVSCYVTYTNSKTHEVILANLDRSPLYSGRIRGCRPEILSVDSRTKLCVFPTSRDTSFL